jgi:hypothetical protein
MHQRVLIFERLTADDQSPADIATHTPNLAVARSDEAQFSP